MSICLNILCESPHIVNSNSHHTVIRKSSDSNQSPKVRSSYGPLAYFSDIFISGKKWKYRKNMQHRKDNIFARNENIGKICKRTITWTDFNCIIISSRVFSLFPLSIYVCGLSIYFFLIFPRPNTKSGNDSLSIYFFLFFPIQKVLMMAYPSVCYKSTLIVVMIWNLLQHLPKHLLNQGSID